MAKKVLVTAAGSGIGFAMCEAFAAEGAEIWAVDIDNDALAKCPESWHRTALDVTDEPAVKKLFTELSASWGSIDCLCANAGIAGPTALIEDIDLVEWQRCVSVNLEGGFLFCKYAVPLMKQAGTGSIILTSSTAGLYGYPSRAPYCAAKWGVIGLCKTLAMELGPFGIRANAICPGAVEGDRMQGVLEREASAKNVTTQSLYDGYASGTSMGKWVTAADIAATASYLAGGHSRMVSGQVIAVDGHTVNPNP
ncbi:MAG: SDR family NAD(P)-dependent oxidoreductase [Granulosicoccaceae bacterium]